MPSSVDNHPHRALWWGVPTLMGFILCIPAAAWMVENVGVCPEDGLGPCLIPVIPGDLLIPSGVPIIGLALVLRDIVQRLMGVRVAFGAILVGASLAAWYAPASLVRASAVAFLVSETLDLLVYTPLQKRRLLLAVVLSSMVGLVADSVIFLYLAFGSLEHLWGQIIGKTAVVVLTVPIIATLRKVI